MHEPARPPDPTDIGADCRRTSANLPDHPNERIKMNSTRKTAVVAGIFFLITEVTAILGMLLYRNSVLSTPQFIVSGTVEDTGVLLRAFLEVLLAIAVVGTGVALYPVIRRQNEGMALGHVAGRVIEATIIAVGAISLLAVVTMVQSLAGTTGPEAVAAATVGQSLVAVHDWTFLFGPKFALGANTLLLAYLMYRSRLVPRFIAVLGLIGAPAGLRFCDRGPVRGVRRPVHHRCVGGRSDTRLGGQPGALDDHEGVPALPGAHGCHAGCRAGRGPCGGLTTGPSGLGCD